MSLEKAKPRASVGVTEHGNSAFLVTVTSKGELLDRRRVDLTEKGLPTHPHHHQGSWAVGRYLNSPWARETSLAEALALVEQVRKSANRCAKEILAALADGLTMPMASIAIRICPPIPASPEACIRDNRIQTYADSVMYRQALAAAAQERGWTVFWYDRDKVFQQAADALQCKDIKAFLTAMGKSVGPPWQAKHKLAAAAAIAAGRPVTI